MAGYRVQNSVFECEVNASEYEILKAKLNKSIDPQKDSLRFYLLGNSYKNRIELLGCSQEHWDRGSFVI